MKDEEWAANTIQADAKVQGRQKPRTAKRGQRPRAEGQEKVPRAPHAL